MQIDGLSDFAMIARGWEVSDGLIKALRKQVNSESAWHTARWKVTSAALVCSHFTEDCLHMLILPFNTSPSVSSLFFNKLEIKAAAHAGPFLQEKW